jgi:hypothetical protein
VRAPFARVLAVAAASGLLAAFAVPASAQEGLGDVLGTTILNDTLTQITTPQLTVPTYPDPEADTQPQTTTKPQTQPQQNQPATSPGPSGRALGYYCRGVSKKRTAGHKKTPFSQCVDAMRNLRTGKKTSPAKACLGLSHKRERGKKSAYALCVSGGRQLLADAKK